jgi:hypothetical protein
MISERERFSETLRTHRRRAPVDEWLQEFCIDEKLKQPQFSRGLAEGLLPTRDAGTDDKTRILRELDMGKREQGKALGWRDALLLILKLPKRLPQAATNFLLFSQSIQV